MYVFSDLMLNNLPCVSRACASCILAFCVSMCIMARPVSYLSPALLLVSLFWASWMAASLRRISVMRASMCWRQVSYKACLSILCSLFFVLCSLLIFGKYRHNSLNELKYYYIDFKESIVILQKMNDEQSTTNNECKLSDCIIIAVLWLVAILLVHPMGNFPLNDDWAYATDVKNLLETGVFNPIGWTSMSLLTHVLWGSLWCSVFGFSFEVLRASTLFISLICLWNVYLIGREIGASRSLALLLALSLAFNPIYFALSFTFMTEVSFMAFVSCAALFFIKYLKNNSIIYWCLAVLFCVIATLSRQTGLFLPLTFTFIFFLSPPLPIAIGTKGESAHKGNVGGGSPLGVRGVCRQKLATRYSQLATHFLPFLLSYAALKLFESHMFATGKIQALYGLQVDELKYLLLNVPEILPLRVLRNIYQASLYLGLMGLPIWVFLAFRTNDFPRRTSYSTAKVVGTVVFPILFLISVLINDSQMPTLVGILEASGVGPRTLHDAYFLQISSDKLPHLFWQMLSYAAALGAGLMWALLACGFLFIFKKEKNNALGVLGNIRRTLLKCQTNGYLALFFLLSAAIYFVPFALVGFYDRYLLPLMMVVPLGVVGLLARFLPPAPSKGGDEIVLSSKGGDENVLSPKGGDEVLTDFKEENKNHSKKSQKHTVIPRPDAESVGDKDGMLNRSTNLTSCQDGTDSASGRGMTVSFGSVLGVFLIILMAIFSITATHDYLAWNSAKWQALHDLTVKENIPTRHIDGGFEFGGWYNFHEIEVGIDRQKSWWWVVEDDYILTFSEIPGYDIHSEYTYNSWWWGERRIFVLSCVTQTFLSVPDEEQTRI